MAKVEQLPDIIALLREYERLHFLLNCGHCVIKIDARCGEYSQNREEHIELWITGDDEGLTEEGVAVVFDLVRSRIAWVDRRLRALGISIEDETETISK